MFWWKFLFVCWFGIVVAPSFWEENVNKNLLPEGEVPRGLLLGRNDFAMFWNGTWESAQGPPLGNSEERGEGFFRTDSPKEGFCRLLGTACGNRSQYVISLKEPVQKCKRKCVLSEGAWDRLQQALRQPWQIQVRTGSEEEIECTYIPPPPDSKDPIAGIQTVIRYQVRHFLWDEVALSTCSVEPLQKPTLRKNFIHIHVLEKEGDMSWSFSLVQFLKKSMGRSLFLFQMALWSGLVAWAIWLFDRLLHRWIPPSPGYEDIFEEQEEVSFQEEQESSLENSEKKDPTWVPSSPEELRGSSEEWEGDFEEQEEKL